jgi:hypothetical protein
VTAPVTAECSANGDTGQQRRWCTEQLSILRPPGLQQAARLSHAGTAVLGGQPGSRTPCIREGRLVYSQLQSPMLLAAQCDGADDGLKPWPRRWRRRQALPTPRKRVRPSRLHVLQKTYSPAPGLSPSTSQTHHRALSAHVCCATEESSARCDARVKALERS